MVMEFFNILMEQNMMASGNLISDMDMVLTFIQMETNMKEIGTMILKMVWVLITILMVIFIRVNGKVENLMVKEITSTRVERLFIRETGKMVKKKDLDN